MKSNFKAIASKSGSVIIKSKKRDATAAPLKSFVNSLNPVSLVAFLSAGIFATFVMPHEFSIFARDYMALVSRLPDIYGKVSAASIWAYCNPRQSHTTATIFTFCYTIPGSTKYFSD